MAFLLLVHIQNKLEATYLRNYVNVRINASREHAQKLEEERNVIRAPLIPEINQNNSDSALE